MGSGGQLEMVETKEKHKCPPHHFMINSNDIGHCKYCPEVRDFRKLQEGERHGRTYYYEEEARNPPQKRGRPKKGVV